MRVLTILALFLTNTRAIACGDETKMKVVITEISQAKGKICYNIWDRGNQAAYPADQSKALFSDCVAVDSLEDVEIELQGVCKTDYGIAVLHDLNNNGEIDTGLFGIPTEPFGFSNNPTIIASQPSWDEVQFAVNDSQRVSTIKLKEF